jgi:hypothetical protein
MDILNIGGMNMDRQQETVGIGDNVPLASVDALTGVKAARPPACVVEALWLSMMAAVGLGFRPSFCRACRTKALTILCHRPVSRQA